MEIICFTTFQENGFYKEFKAPFSHKGWIHMWFEIMFSSLWKSTTGLGSKTKKGRNQDQILDNKICFKEPSSLSNIIG